MPSNVPYYSGLDENDRARLLNDVQNAFAKAATASVTAADEEDDTTSPLAATPETIEVPEFPDLIGIDPSVYRQIQAAL